MATAKSTIGKTSKPQKETAKKQFNIDNFIPEKYQTTASLVILFLLFLIFFFPLYFGGKTFQSGDIVTSKSLGMAVKNHHDTGFTLWNPYIFCGMPAYALGVEFKWFNLIYVGISSIKWIFVKLFSVEYATWTLYLILLAFTSYFLMKFKTKNTLVSLFSAIAASFSTGLIVFLFIGHVTKLTSLCMYPLIFLMLLKFQKKIKLLDFAILTIALQLFVQGWHVQIIFYTLFAVGIYFIYYIIHSLVKKERYLTKQLLKSLGVFAGAMTIALLIQSDNLTQIYEYTPYSTRGAKSVVETKTNAREEQASGSAYYDYHTQWSFSPGEVLTFIIPSYYGFGNSTYLGPVTNNQEYKLNTYFGQMEWVDVAMYMGVLVFFMALFAVFTCWRDPFVRFLAILSGIALLVSFGKTFSPFFDLMFYYFPYFDKFRVPSMILVLVQMSFPFLAGLGLNKIISLKWEKDQRAENIVKYATYGFAGLFILSLVLSTSLKDLFITRMLKSQRAAQQPEMFGQLSDYVSSMFISDILIAFAICAAAFGIAQAYIRSKISRDLLVIGFIIFTIFDLWRIDSRGAEYVQSINMDQVFREPDYITAVKAQKDLSPYRIISLKQDGSYGSVLGQHANYFMYFQQQDLYGYSGIKPRAYQDILDVIGTVANPTLWKMLNVKYIIFDKPVNFSNFTEVARGNQGVVYRYDPALPRAYFVDTVQTMPAIQILNLIKNNAFEPKQIAFLEESSLNVDRPDTTQVYAKIISYKEEHIFIDAKATGSNFLFLGDTYFPKGWKALIDGKETKIYRTNHNFRGIVVPKGEHKIEFAYEPISFYLSQRISFAFSLLVILGGIIGLLMDRRRKNNELHLD